MKIIFTFLFLNFFLIDSFSQSYLPFPTQNVQWNCTFYESWGGAGPNEYYSTDEMSYFTNGDTLINNLTYTQLLKTQNHIETTVYLPTGQITNTSIFYSVAYDGAYRNDSLNQKVFYIPKNYFSEKILYDFSLTAGDTIYSWIDDSVNGWWPNRSWLPTIAIVDSVDSVLIDNTYRSCVYISGGFDQVTLIAGIGPTCGILNPVIGSIMDVISGYLNCFSISSQTIYPDSQTACLILSIPENIKQPTLEIYPNPAQHFISISSPFSETKYFIYDNLGRLLLSGITNGLVNLPELNNGIYQVILISKTITESRILSIMN